MGRALFINVILRGGKLDGQLLQVRANDDGQAPQIGVFDWYDGGGVQRERHRYRRAGSYDSGYYYDYVGAEPSVEEPAVLRP